MPQSLSSRNVSQFDRPLADAHQPQPRAVCGVRHPVGLEPPAVVLDRDHERFGEAPDEHAARRRLGMSRHVGERLLNGPVGAHLDVGGQPLREPILDEFGADAGAVRKLPQIPLERVRQAEVVQHGRPQQLREVAHAAQRVVRHRARLPDRSSGAPIGADRLFGDRQLHLHGRQCLSDFIMQLASDAPALVFMGAHELCRQALQIRPVPRDLGVGP